MPIVQRKAIRGGVLLGQREGFAGHFSHPARRSVTINLPNPRSASLRDAHGILGSGVRSVNLETITEVSSLLLQ